MPFGEYVPWRSKLDWISATDQIPVDRTPGSSVHTVAAPGVPPFGTPICFENSFPDLPRDFVRDGATFLVVPVNNASYGFTAASDQHLQMSRMRAVETGRWIVDAAVSGVSAFVDTHGRVVARTGLFQTTILRDRLRTSTATTWYVRTGGLAAVALSGAPRGSRCSRLVAAPRSGLRRHPLPTPLRALAVLPTYEERETIQRVIEGLLGGPTPPDIVVVDDSSPDGTGDIVRAIAADRTAGSAPRAAGEVRPGERVPGGVPSGALGGVRRRDRDGLRPVPRSGGAPGPPAGRGSRTT